MCGREHAGQGCVWQGGMRGRGMHGRGHAWWGVCMVGVHGTEHAWRGACVAGGHVWGGMRGMRDGHCYGRYASHRNAFLL